MRRTLAIATGGLALISGAYALWCALRLRRIASTYSNGIGFLVHGHPHYSMTFRNYYLWLNGEAALAGVGGVGLIAGAVLAAKRRAAGLTVMIGGCAVIIAQTTVGWIVATKMIRWFAEIGADEYGVLWFNLPNKPTIVALSFVLPVTAAVLALIAGARPRGASTGPLPR
jgi:hypothetical protein